MPAAKKIAGESLADRFEQGDPFWPAQLAVAAAVLLNMFLSDRVSAGPRWLLPGVAAILLVTLVVVLPMRATAHSMARRRFSLVVVGVVTIVNAISLALLVHYLVSSGTTDGEPLLLSGAALWATNVLLFAVWYWELDCDGPVVRFLEAERLPDFQFPQLENPQLAPKNWRPQFSDYLYTSLTNATAFSPTDTMPLTGRAKLIMGIQSVTALLTVGLVVARAVNILG